MNVARRLEVDPELELRAAAGRFRARVVEAERLADADGVSWAKLGLAEQDRYFDLAKHSEVQHSEAQHSEAQHSEAQHSEPPRAPEDQVPR